MQAWAAFLTSFNGRVICLPDSWISSFSLKLYTDASAASYAAVFGSQWIQRDFPSTWQNVNIAVKELVPIVLAVHLWGDSLKNKKITFFCDNQAIVSVINNQSSKDTTIMTLVRKLVLTSLTQNFVFASKHIPGRHNVIADCLSRSQIDRTRRIAPWLDTEAQQVPTTSLPW